MKTDRQLQQHVMDELHYEPSLDESEIGVNVSGGLVALEGRVKTYAEKLAALHAVERVAGVVAVANELSVVPTRAFEHTDVDIAEATLHALCWLSSLPRDVVKVRVEDGWVTLEGKVEWWYQRDHAENVVRPLAGVRGVTNQIVVESPLKVAEVTRQIEAALARSAALHAQEIKVETRDRRVILRGKVHSWDERREAEYAAWAAPGVSEVENELAVTT